MRLQVTGVDQRLVWCNRAAERLLGWSREDVLGRDIRELQTTGPGETLQRGGGNTGPHSQDLLSTRLQAGKVTALTQVPAVKDWQPGETCYCSRIDLRIT